MCSARCINTIQTKSHLVPLFYMRALRFPHEKRNIRMVCYTEGHFALIVPDGALHIVYTIGSTPFAHCM